MSDRANIEAEEQVLGALLTKNDVWERVHSIVRADDFYDDGHAYIYGAIADQAKSGGRIDVVTVSDYLQSHGLLAKVGGSSRLAGLTSLVATTAHVEHHAGIVARYSRLRKMIRLGQDIQARAETAQDVSEVLPLLEPGKFDNPTGKPKLLHFGETIEEAKKLLATEGQIIGLKTGWDNIDQMFMGMRPGQLLIFYGDTKHRKSIFAQNLAAQVAMQNNPVLFVGLELVAEENTERWLTMGYEDLPIVYPENRMPGYDEIDNLVGVAVEEGIKLVVIDHLHMWQADKNVADFITEVLQEMKRVALKHRVPVILISHISGDKEATGPPSYKRLKGSTSIAQLADKVVCIYSPGVEYEGPDNYLQISIPLSRRLPNAKSATLTILKNARLIEQPGQPNIQL